MPDHPSRGDGAREADRPWAVASSFVHGVP